MSLRPALWLFLTACGGAGGPFQVHHQKAATQLALGTDSVPADGPLLWRKDGLQIALRQPTTHPWLMVQSDRPMPEDLQNLAWITLTPPQRAPYHLMAWPESAAELHRLSTWAHDAGCGTLKYIAAAPQLATRVTVSSPRLPSLFAYQGVRDLLSHLNMQDFRDAATALEQLGSRYHLAPNGVKASDTVLAAFTAAGQGISGFSVRKFTHSLSSQYSVIATITGSVDPNTIVIIGAHLDSINSSNLSNAPGGDDDASGVATQVALLKAIASSGSRFGATLEFQAYAIEEIGLIGSGEIALQYRNEKKKVSGMLQLDMTGYYDPSGKPAISLITNHTHRNVTYDLKALADSYLNVPTSLRLLQRGSSDHESWTDQGFPSAFPFENPDKINPRYHTAGDTISALPSLDQATVIAKLSLAFLGHYGGLRLVENSTNLRPNRKVATDAPVAIYDGESGSYHVSVAADSATAAVQVCLVEPASGGGCAAERLLLTADGGIGGRSVFSTATKIALASGKHLRLHFYDSQESLLGYREVKIL